MTIRSSHAARDRIVDGGRVSRADLLEGAQ